MIGKRQSRGWKTSSVAVNSTGEPVLQQMWPWGSQASAWRWCGGNRTSSYRSAFQGAGKRYGSSAVPLCCDDAYMLQYFDVDGRITYLFLAAHRMACIVPAVVYNTARSSPIRTMSSSVWASSRLTSYSHDVVGRSSILPCPANIHNPSTGCSPHYLPPQSSTCEGQEEREARRAWCWAQGGVLVQNNGVGYVTCFLILPSSDVLSSCCMPKSHISIHIQH